jgi:hypothetical protein
MGGWVGAAKVRAVRNPLQVGVAFFGYEILSRGFCTATPADVGELQRYSTDSGVVDPYSSGPWRTSADDLPSSC